jgi:hypothetical protein
MAAGHTAISAEIQVIINMLIHLQRKEDEENVRLVWTKHSNDNISAKTHDFTLTLWPESRGRWSVSIVHRDGYSHPWPQWQTSLENAKRKALFCLAAARRHMLEYAHFQRS